MAQRGAGAALLLVGLLAFFAFGYVWTQWAGPGPLKAEATLIIPKGAVAGEIGRQLAAARVIRGANLFSLGARLGPPDKPLKSGEYAFPAGISLRDVLQMLQDGRTVVRKLTIPEGLTTAQVIGRLEAADGLEGEIDAAPGEGTLLPATYGYSYGDSRRALLQQMASAMRRTVETLWAGRAADLPLHSPEEAVILASIVEKETGVAAERQRIAAVFINRLRAGMRLQADPTVAYAVGAQAGPLGRSLTRTDLRTAHPYNTYLVDGLPPGPIANPGRASLAAVLQPDQSDDLYFVADGSGGHAFARTYDEHKRNVARWRGLSGAVSEGAVDPGGKGGN